MKNNMTKIMYLFITASLFLTSCSNDDDSSEPVAAVEAVLSRTEMISRTWVYEKVTQTTTTSNNGLASVNNVDVSSIDFEQEFFADGTQIIRNSGQDYTGTWEFFNDHSIHTTYDSDPNTINSSIIAKLTKDEFWVGHTTTTEDNGVTTVNVYETKFVPKP